MHAFDVEDIGIPILRILLGVITSACKIIGTTVKWIDLQKVGIETNATNKTELDNEYKKLSQTAEEKFSYLFELENDIDKVKSVTAHIKRN